ncbi:MAG: hypothetical protein JW969_00660 [Spirochaetales bacterium]|nr:hypothetical protein [Spirochaetales bacterium]
MKRNVFLFILILFLFTLIPAVFAQTITIENIIIHTDARLTFTVFKGQIGLNISAGNVIANKLRGRSLKLACWIKADGGNWVPESYTLVDLGTAKSDSWLWKNVFIEYTNQNLIQWFGKGVHYAAIGIGVYDSGNLSHPLGYKTLNFRLYLETTTENINPPPLDTLEKENTINLSISTLLTEAVVEIGVDFQYKGRKNTYQAVLDITQAGKIKKREVVSLNFDSDKNGRITWKIPKNELGLGLFMAIINVMDGTHTIVGSAVQTFSVNF